MPRPKRPTLNRARERRIELEIVVDAYASNERAIGWHCYLGDKLRFPFKAKCIAAREMFADLERQGSVVEGGNAMKCGPSSPALLPEGEGRRVCSAWRRRMTA